MVVWKGHSATKEEVMKDTSTTSAVEESPPQRPPREWYNQNEKPNPFHRRIGRAQQDFYL
jgi:hypothetical protein